MFVGIDFDNTIVSYDDIFYTIALEQGLIPANFPKEKSAVRDHLRNHGQEDLWTEMQGTVYGSRMIEATPCPDVKATLAELIRHGINVAIISHKTRAPYRGAPADLHAAALEWLEVQGFFDSAHVALPRDRVIFNLTKQEKLACIGSWNCTHFVDDLPELLLEPTFPTGVRRILFDPNNNYPDDPRYVRLTAWTAILQFLLEEYQTSILVSQLMPQGQSLASKANLGTNIALEPVPGGRNNRAFRLTTDGKSFFLKSYFRNPNDMRDRLNAEFSFSRFAWENGVRSIPEPIAQDTSFSLGLYEFIDGQKLEAGQITIDHVWQAANLFRHVNQHRSEPLALKLPVASEACFSIDEHLACVRRRIQALQEITTVVAIDREAKRFVSQRLIPAATVIARQVEIAVNSLGGTTSASLPQAARCISPSDFGYHNALFASDGRLRFVDFEYAGWDDPAKMVCDFFSQPDVPVPESLLQLFMDQIDAPCYDAAFMKRVECLLPLYRVKWCCIMLNEFLPIGNSRRSFSHGITRPTKNKESQLAKTVAYFHVHLNQYVPQGA